MNQEDNIEDGLHVYSDTSVFDKARLSTVSRPGRDKLYRAPTGKKLSLGLCG